jgi:hypothetical protein
MNNMNKKRLIAFSLLVLSFAGIHAQTQGQTQDMNLSDALKQLLDNALQVNISATVLPAGANPVWSVESSKLTIPGRSVKVRLDGENVQIYLTCTPYTQDNGDILLVAQGQVWFTKPPDGELKILNTFQSIPVTFGEKVLFFPLGVPKSAKENKYFNIELEIQIVPYRANKGESTEGKGPQ